MFYIKFGIDGLIDHLLLFSPGDAECHIIADEASRVDHQGVKVVSLRFADQEQLQEIREVSQNADHSQVSRRTAQLAGEDRLLCVPA